MMQENMLEIRATSYAHSCRNIIPLQICHTSVIKNDLLKQEFLSRLVKVASDFQASVVICTKPRKQISSVSNTNLS